MTQYTDHMVKILLNDDINQYIKASKHTMIETNQKEEICDYDEKKNGTMTESNKSVYIRLWD